MTPAGSSSPATAAPQGHPRPGPGEYIIAVWLRDSAGNESEANAETATLRFDDTQPPASRLAAPSGWISTDELPTR